MSLYEMFKKLLPVSEQFGKIIEADMREKSKYSKAGVTITGMDAKGRKFKLELELEDAQDAEKLE